MPYGKILRHRGETVTLAATGSIGFAQTRGIPPGMNKVEIEVPSATKENILVALSPKIKKIWFYDNSAGTYTDLTAALTDRNTGTTTGSSLNEMQAADFLYFGCDARYRGLSVDVANTNSLGTATAAVTYWNGSAWTTATPTDGTLSTRTLAQDGLITWTVPTDWARTTVNSEPTSLFWVRYAVSANLTDTSVSIAEVVTLANLTISNDSSDTEGFDRIYMQSNAQSLPPYCIHFDDEIFGGIELTSTSITSAANVNWYRVT